EKRNTDWRPHGLQKTLYYSCASHISSPSFAAFLPYLITPWLLHTMWSTTPQCNNDWSILLQPLSYIFLFLSSMINPILYAFLSKRFREAASDIFYCKYVHSTSPCTLLFFAAMFFTFYGATSRERHNPLLPNAVSAYRYPSTRKEGSHKSRRRLLLRSQIGNEKR
ncbi:hypothetical protein OSTOST_15716, partial [Ostertagia ostertagi]